MGTDAIPSLIFAFSEISDSAKAARLRLLQGLIVDGSINAMIEPCLGSDHAPLRLEAIRFLAAHPGMGDAGYLEWTRKLLSRGDKDRRDAYLGGMPAMPLTGQVEAVIESFPAFSTPTKIRAMDWIRTGKRDEASGRLDALFRMIIRGELESELLLPLAHALKKTATPRASGPLRHCMTSSSADLRTLASGMRQAAEEHLFRSRAFIEIVAFRDLLLRTFPSRWDLGLDLADAMIQYGRGGDTLPPMLADLEQAFCRDGDTASMLAFAEIEMARALNAFWKEEPWQAFLESPSGEASRIGSSYPMRRIEAKQDLLRGALKILDGSDGAPDFRSALDRAPYDGEIAEIDGIFLGRFSLSNLVWRLSRAGREDEALRIFETLVTVLQEDDAGCGYYPAAKDRSNLPDRIRSAIPLYEANFLLHRCGKPEAAREKLAAFIESNQDSTLFANTDLLARAHFNQGLALLDLNRRAGSSDAFKKGIKCYEQLLEAMKEVWPGPSRREMMEYYRREKARGLLYVQTATLTGPDDARKCEELARKALDAAPDFPEAILTFALVQARSGLHDYALQVLGRIDPYPDRYYNIACLLALSNRPEEALDHLDRHLNEYTPPRRRALEKRYASKDPDLASLRGLPEFDKLVGGAAK
jgi:tetratricopeptide (TPR) repeat protein